MKSIVSVGFILTVILMPHLGVIGYLTSIGDYGAIEAAAAVLSIPGNFVLSMLS